MTMYEGFHFWGMHLFWWFLWIMFIIWAFATPYKIPGQQKKYSNPIDILKKRLAAGEISNEEFIEKKALLKSL